MAKKIILFLLILVGVSIFAQALVGFWLWTKGVPIWGEAFTSLNYSGWLETLSHAWGNQSALGISHLYFPESQGQYALFTANAWTSARYWLEAMALIEKIFGPFVHWFYLNLSVAIPFLGMFYLAWVWTKKNIWLSTMAGLLLMLSPITLERLMAGVNTYVISIGLFAFLIALYMQYGRRPNRRENNLILLGLFITAGIFPAIIPHFLIIFAVWWLADFICPGLVKPEFGVQKRSSKMIALLVVIFGAALLSFSIWWPSVIYELPTRSISQSFFQLRTLKIGSENMTYFKTFTLSSGGLENGLKIFTEYPYLLYLRLVFLLVMVIGALKINKRYSYLLLLFFVVGTILSVGDRPPFGWLFVDFYKYLPGFSTFRDPSKFLILLVIPFILITVDLLASVVAKLKVEKFSAPISLAIALVISFLTVPYVYFGKLHEVINPTQIPQEFTDLSKWLDSKAQANSRAFLWPDLAEIDSELKLKTPIKSFQKSVFTGFTHSQVSFTNPTGIYNVPSSEYLLNLKQMISEGRWGSARDYYALDYVIENKKLDQDFPLTNVSQLKKVFENKTFVVYQIPGSSSEKLFIENNPIILSSGRPIYKLFSHSITPVTFDSVSFKQNLPKQIPLLIYDREKLDVLLELASPNYILDPTKIARHNTGESWQSFSGNDTDMLEQQITGVGQYSIYTDSPAELKMNYDADQDSKIYIKVLVGNQRGNNLKFLVNGQKVSEGELKGLGLEEYHWFEVGQVSKGRGEFTIKSLRRERAIVDKIMIVPDQVMSQIEKKFDEFIKNRPKFVYYSPEYLLTKDSTGFSRGSSFKDFQLISTENDLEKYLPKSERVYLSEKNLNQLKISSPQLIVNQSSFDANWRLGQISPVYALGYAQGYFVSDSSQLGDLKYLPESDYRLAQLVTMIVWILALIALVLAGLSTLVQRKKFDRSEVPK